MSRTSQITSSKWLKYLPFIVTAGLLFTYTAYRAATLSFTHDESFCYTRYVIDSYWNIISYAYPTANNHLINTLGMKFFGELFAPTEFFLRLPNLLAHLLYLYFSFLFVRKHPFWIAFTGFILINCNPYLLDFFSLARGYGLSTSFILVSVYFLFAYLNHKSLKNVYLSLGFGALAVLSNFILLHVYVSLLFLFNLLYLNDYFIEKKNKMFVGWIKINIPALLISIPLAGIIYEPIRKLIVHNEFYARGVTGFWEDTFVTYVMGSLYEKRYLGQRVEPLMYIITAILLFFLVLFVIKWIKKRYNLSGSIGLFSILVLILPAFSTIAQHHLTGSEFLVFRTTLFFHPLLALCLFFGLDEMIKIDRLKVAGYALMIIIGGSFLFHTLICMNTDLANEWKYDAGTKFIVEKLTEDVKKNNREADTIRLGISWVFEPSVNYYRLSRKLKWLKEVNRDGFKGDFDYYYVVQEDTVNMNFKEVLAINRVSGSVLAK